MPKTNECECGCESALWVLRAIAPKLEVTPEYLETGGHTDPLTPLDSVAREEEAQLLDDLAVRAGLLWACEDDECRWLNREEATRCAACGKLMNSAFLAAMTERRPGEEGRAARAPR